MRLFILELLMSVGLSFGAQAHRCTGTICTAGGDPLDCPQGTVYKCDEYGSCGCGSPPVNNSKKAKMHR